MRNIATMPAVHARVVRHWLAYAYRKPYRDPTLDQQVTLIASRFMASGGELPRLLVDIGMELLAER